jgi:hypothetical protein
MAEGRSDDQLRNEMFLERFTFFSMTLYIFVWYNGSIHLILQFMAPIHEMPNPNEVSHYLEYFPTRTGSQLRPFHYSVRHPVVH